VRANLVDQGQVRLVASEAQLVASQAGSAREHLHRWIAAAATIQRAARAWLLRRGVKRFCAAWRRRSAAVAVLQAAWRGRAVRRRYLRQRQAAVCIQVKFSQRSSRSACPEQLAVP
jgi:hypothetical protein